MPAVATRIGTLREKPLHASLKRWYAQAGDRAEVAVDGFVIDLVRGELLIEIQTRGLSAMRPKLTALLAGGRTVRVVHPIAVDRWIVNVDDDGAVLARRRSPRHGTLTDLVAEVVGLPDLLAHPNLEVEVLLTREEEYRRHDPSRCWRRRGWTVLERRLVEVVERVVFTSAQDFADLIPDGLPERFTATDLALCLGRPLRVGQQLAYFLRRAGLIEATGSRGRAPEYRFLAAPSSRAARPDGDAPGAGP